MKKIPAFGAIVILISLLIIGIIFATVFPTILKSSSIDNISRTKEQQESIKEQTNAMIEDINQKRQQTLKYYEEN